MGAAYRANAYSKFLQEKEKYTVKDLEELQMDQKNLYGKEFTPIFLKELNKASLNEVERRRRPINKVEFLR